MFWMQGEFKRIQGHKLAIPGQKLITEDHLKPPGVIRIGITSHKLSWWAKSSVRGVIIPCFCNRLLTNFISYSLYLAGTLKINRKPKSLGSSNCWLSLRKINTRSTRNKLWGTKINKSLHDRWGRLCQCYIVHDISHTMRQYECLDVSETTLSSDNASRIANRLKPAYSGIVLIRCNVTNSSHGVFAHMRMLLGKPEEPFCQVGLNNRTGSRWWSLRESRTV